MNLAAMTIEKFTPAMIGAGAALIGVWVLRWCITRRTLLAERPHLTRRGFDLFDRAEWLCSRCETPIILGVGFCRTCGQPQNLLAERPHLTRRWFGLFGRAEWRCTRCETPINLGVGFCRTCGQPQKWPDWVYHP